MNLEQHLRIVPNFPKTGIDFLDISPLLQDPKLLSALIEQLAIRAKRFQFDKIVAIESRGFILGSALAMKLEKGFVMIRKKGKLPGKTFQQSYDLEYGSDTIEILASSLQKNERVLVLDDVLATGGTAAATCQLIQKVGGQVAGALFLIELGFLSGRNKLPTAVESLIIKS